MSKKTSPFVKEIKSKLKLTFKHQRFLESALIHPSGRTPQEHKSLHNFDRLEFFGDSILNFVICKKIYKYFPEANEGQLSRIRSAIVSRKVLARIALDLELNELARFGRQLKAQTLDNQSKVMADIFESLLAAIYLDQGLEKCEKFILKHFEPYFNTKRLFQITPNPKSALQEFCQKQWNKLPVYESKVTSKGVKVTVSVGASRKATVTEDTRRLAEKKAAQTLFRKLRQDTKGSLSNKKRSRKK